MNKVLSVTAFGLALMAVSPSDAAVCNRNDLANRPWDVYKMLDIDGVAYTQKCTMNFNNQGALILSSNCIADTREKSTLRGLVTVTPACKLSGTIYEWFPDVALEVVCPVQGTMAQDKWEGAGMGNCGPLTVFTFHMVKR
jgi:hypothetical protein